MYVGSERFRRVTDGLLVNGALAEQTRVTIANLVSFVKAEQAGAINIKGSNAQKAWLAENGQSMETVEQEIRDSRNESKILDRLVYQVKAEEASKINSADAMVDWLLDNKFSEKELREVLQNSVDTPFNKSMKTMKMFECSTAHLSSPTLEWLEKDHVREQFEYLNNDYGYILTTRMADENTWPTFPEFPPDLLHILRYANANGHEWLYLDQERSELDPNLPWYEEDTYSSSGSGVVVAGKFHPATHGPAMKTKTFKHYDLCAYQHFIDPAHVSPGQLKVTKSEPVLEDNDYIIPDGESAWFTIRGMALCIRDMDDHVKIDGTVCNHEDTGDDLFEQIVFHADIDDMRKEIERKLKDSEAEETSPEM